MGTKAEIIMNKSETEIIFDVDSYINHMRKGHGEDVWSQDQGAQKTKQYIKAHQRRALLRPF